MFDISTVLAGEDARYDVVLSSETIYRLDSVPALLHVLRDACLARSEDLIRQSTTPPPYTCLIAAKRLYFGVGGGVLEFEKSLKDGGLGDVEHVWEHTSGVGRTIMRVVWK
jgi:protein-histidine N-methyltransferase